MSLSPPPLSPAIHQQSCKCPFRRNQHCPPRAPPPRPLRSHLASPPTCTPTEQPESASGSFLSFEPSPASHTLKEKPDCLQWPTGLCVTGPRPSPNLLPVAPLCSRHSSHVGPQFPQSDQLRCCFQSLCLEGSLPRSQLRPLPYSTFPPLPT